MNIHGKKEITIDDLPQVDSFTTEVSFHFEKVNGFEEDKSITLSDTWESELLSRYLAAYRSAVKHVKAEVESRYEDVDQWAEGESSLQSEDAAVARYENSRG